MKKVFAITGLLVIILAIISGFIPALQLGVIMLTAPVIIGGNSQSVIKGLTEQMGKAHRQICDLDLKVETEKRSYTPDEDQQRQAWTDEFENAKLKREKLMQNEERSRLMSEVDNEISEKRNNAGGDEFKEKYSKAFRNYIMSGLEGLTIDERSMLNSALEVETRALSKGTNNAGGYTVPEGFEKKIDIALKYYAGVLELGSILETATGKDIPWPTVNDTTNTGELLAEAASIGNSVDPSFGEVVLKAYKFSSKKILVSPELLDDNEVDIETILANMIGERIGRIINTYGTTGTGSSQPQGYVVGAAASGVTAAVSAITFENLIDVLHSVDIAYRRNGKWAFNDTTLKALRKIKDGEDRYIWQPSLTSEAPATILGAPYVINNDMASIGASAKSVVFGDFSKFKIRMVAGYRFRRLMELDAATDQIGYIAFKRASTHLIDAGTNPLKYLVHAAS